MNNSKKTNICSFANYAFWASLTCLLAFILIAVSSWYWLLRHFLKVVPPQPVTTSQILEVLFAILYAIWILSALFGFIIAILAIYRIACSKGAQKGFLRSLLALVIILISVFILPEVSLAILLPGDSRLYSNMMQAGLQKIHQFQTDYHNKNGRFAASCNDIKSCRPNPFFTYYLSKDHGCYFSISDQGRLPLPSGISPFVQDHQFLIATVGNVDDDQDLEVWTIDEKGLMKEAKKDLTFKENIRNRVRFAKYMIKNFLSPDSQDPMPNL